MTKKRINLSVDIYVMEKIKEYADAENRSVSNYVEKVLKQHVQDKEE